MDIIYLVHTLHTGCPVATMRTLPDVFLHIAVMLPGCLLQVQFYTGIGHLPQGKFMVNAFALQDTAIDGNEHFLREWNTSSCGRMQYILLLRKHIIISKEDIT